ncbi:hypothetical protein [Streptomyces sp. 058-1L]|uniref:hypothetical protein n=1 Tax=Streptomyces sp. 058-1L TaxID=2789266 RepID=UPI00397F0DC3
MPGCDIVQKPFRGPRQQGERQLNGELMAYGQERELQLAVWPLGIGMDWLGDGRAGRKSEQGLAREPHQGPGTPVEPDGLSNAQSARPVGEDLDVERRRHAVVAFEGHPRRGVQARPEGERGGPGQERGYASSGPRLILRGLQAEHRGEFQQLLGRRRAADERHAGREPAGAGPEEMGYLSGEVEPVLDRVGARQQQHRHAGRVDRSQRPGVPEVEAVGEALALDGPQDQRGVPWGEAQVLAELRDRVLDPGVLPQLAPAELVLALAHPRVLTKARLYAAAAAAGCHSGPVGLAAMGAYAGSVNSRTPAGEQVNTTPYFHMSANGTTGSPRALPDLLGGQRDDAGVDERLDLGDAEGLLVQLGQARGMSLGVWAPSCRPTGCWPASQPYGTGRAAAAIR